MKKAFSTGLVIFLPLFLTFLIIKYVINFLTSPFLNPAFNGWKEIFPSVANAPWILPLSQLLILGTAAALIILIGLFAENLFLRFIISGTHHTLHKLPLINKIYHTTESTISTLFASSNKEALRPVFVPFGPSNQYVIGFAVGESFVIHNHFQNHALVSVFVPETPNPTVGFMLLYKKEELLPSKMSVDEAMKQILSCGAVGPCTN